MQCELHLEVGLLCLFTRFPFVSARIFAIFVAGQNPILVVEKFLGFLVIGIMNFNDQAVFLAVSASEPEP